MAENNIMETECLDLYTCYYRNRIIETERLDLYTCCYINFHGVTRADVSLWLAMRMSLITAP